MPSPSPTLDARLRQACSELERRLHAGDAWRTEDVLAAYPDLVTSDDAVLEIIYTEYVLREELGQGPSPADWLVRFPQYRAGLEQVFQIHETATKPEALALAAPAAETGLAGYELLAELGRGGMGVVYKARQRSLNRVVALKMVLGGQYAAPADLARFHIEAEAAARLHHPNIVRIFEIGEDRGRPYLVLEYVDGGGLDRRLSGAPLAPRAAAGLVEPLAHAVHHAHQQGIIHRDLKPANILLSVPSSEFQVPGGDGAAPAPLRTHNLELTTTTPKVSDFGLARRLDASGGPTATGDLVGTPSYMAPEQAEGRAKEVGPWTDVYGLGAILYECLTGRPPFRGSTAVETMQMVREQEPVPPRRLVPTVPRDLETICLKCLEKRPEKRYASAGELAQRLRLFLDGRPIPDRPTTALDRGLRWGRRHPARAALAATVLVVVGLVLVALVQDTIYRREKGLREEAERQKGRTEELLHTTEYVSRLRAYRERLTGGDADRGPRAQALLATLAPVEGGPERRGFEAHWLRRLFGEGWLTAAEKVNVQCLAVSPDGRTLAWSGHASAVVSLSDLAGGEGRALPAAGRVAAVFDPRGRWLATDGLGGEVWLWDVAKRQRGAAIPFRQAVRALAVAPDGSALVIGGARGKVAVWDTVGERLAELRPALPGNVWSVAVAPDGRALAAAAGDGTVALWHREKEGWNEERRLTGHQGQVYGAAFLDGGAALATAGEDGTVRVWDLPAGRLRRVLTGHAGEVKAVALLADGSLASAGQDGTIRLWDLAVGKEQTTLLAHSGEVNALCPLSGDLVLASGGAGGAVKLWARGDGVPFRGHGRFAHAVAVSPDATMIASAGGGSEGFRVRLWEAATGRPVGEPLPQPRRPLTVAFSPTAPSLLAVGGAADKGTGGFVRLHDLATRQVRDLAAQADDVSAVAFSPDGTSLATADAQGVVRLWDVATGEVRRVINTATRAVRSLAFRPDGEQLALACREPNVVLVHRTADGECMHALSGHEAVVLSVAFRPDGGQIVSGDSRGVVRFWDAATGTASGTIQEAAPVYGLAVAPDGRTLATATGGGPAGVGGVRLWHMATRLELLVLQGRPAEVRAVAFGPDGRTLAACWHNGTLQLWRAVGP